MRTIVIGQTILKDLSILEMQAEFEKTGTTLEIHSAGNYLVGKMEGMTWTEQRQ